MVWGDGWDMGWMWLIGPLTLVVIVLLGLLVVRQFGGGDRGGASACSGSVPAKSQARLILDERFAKGEVTANQYREQLQLLGDHWRAAVDARVCALTPSVTETLSSCISKEDRKRALRDVTGRRCSNAS